MSLQAYSSTTELKKALRQRMLSRRDALTSELRVDQSAAIRDQLLSLVEQRGVRVLHSFLPMGSEVDLFPLLDRAMAMGVEVYAPKTLKARQLEHHRYHGRDRLVPGVFGTHHPAGDQPYTGTFDLIIVPGLAFTQEGHRLGYGAGYYDTFLPQHPTAHTVAVCYPFQVLDAVPVEAHDVAVRQVVCGDPELPSE